MEECLQVIKGYFEACKNGKEPKEFTQLSIQRKEKICTAYWSFHGELVEGEEINIKILEIEELVVPFKRKKVTFSLNTDIYQVVIIREKEPIDGKFLFNWQNDEGQLGLNPCSLRRLNTR